MPKLIKIGIFLGGSSREREVSFAGGRTVYDNLDQAIFEPVPIFVDSLGNFILLDWQYLYKGTIRDFYPPPNLIPPSNFSVYIESLHGLTMEQTDHLIDQVGEKITPDQFSTLFDFALLALHGPCGEDGSIQGLLEWYQIPYSGTGILGSAIGIDKIIQKKLMQACGLTVPPYQILSKSTWETTDKSDLFETMIASLGLPFVVKSPRQGSSIGVSIVKEKNIDAFIKAVHQSLFIQEITALAWQQRTTEAKKNWMVSLIDMREGIGLPVRINEQIIAHPDELLKFLENHFATSNQSIKLTSIYREEEVLLESFIQGREFSCIVLENQGEQPIALPPTEIIKGDTHFDYRAKYLPGIVRKHTPIQLGAKLVHQIRKACVQLFALLGCQVYARIDGFLTPDQTIYLTDPNTTAGMNPSSFLFHQAAEIGLNPSQFLTFLIRTSLAERMRIGKTKLQAELLRKKLAKSMEGTTQAGVKKTRVGVLMGGFSAERHISVESGRNIYEKLASSTQYTPIPLFLCGTPVQHHLFILPINMLLKDNADDIHEKLLHSSSSQSQAVVASIQQEATSITNKYAGKQAIQLQEIAYSELATYVDTVFIALHGRPGEDGAIQARLANIPYNGSGIETSQLTIHKFKTNQLLKSKGIHVAAHTLITQAVWEEEEEATIRAIEDQFAYPFIAKPVDDGCSAAVIKISHRAALIAYAEAIFRKTAPLSTRHVATLRLKPHAAFPQKEEFMIEDFIEQGEAQHLLEITGGLLTHLDEQGRIHYEVFEPSETLATGDVLSLEEKFLAGEGQNITPARFHPDPTINRKITKKVKQDLEKVARILAIEGYARIDAFVKIYEENYVETWIIEVNTLPAMTPATCIFHQCARNGYKPFDFIHAIIQYGLKKHQQKNKFYCDA